MPQVSLSPRSRVLPAADQGPRITEAGIFLGPSPLAVQRKSGVNAAAIYETTDVEELAETLAVAFGWGVLSDFDARLRYLQSAAKSLGDGALTQAHISLAFMNLPKLTPDAVDRLRQLEVMRKQGHDVSNEPRVPAGDQGAGEWTSYGPVDHTGRNPTQPWRDQPNVTFRNFIANAERSTTGNADTDGYGAHNQSGQALGRYQLQKRTALIAIGWMDAKGNWTSEAARHGITSDDDFLKNRDAQELAMNLYLQDNERQMTRMNVTVTNPDGSKHVVTLWDLGAEGQTYIDVHGNTITIDQAGLAAAAHREGARAVHDYINWLAANNWNVRGMRFADQDAGPRIAQRLQNAQGLPYQPLYAH
jgi:hypothetical protein